MKFGEIGRKQMNYLKGGLVGLSLLAASGAAYAQEATAEVAEAASTYTPLGPDMIKGAPVSGAIGLQPQYSVIGEAASPLHHGLVWFMAIISVFVLALLLWVVLRYNHRSNPVPSKTSHNTALEVIWTGVPILILVVITLFSLPLIAKQYENPPEDALTVKITGYQWYWGYSFPDNGDFEVVSNMMPHDDAVAAGLPPQLEVDNRLVLPVGVPIRMQVTAADVIHSFAVPSLWFKIDAVPGRLNERPLIIKEPGIYYGQCSELCGVRHGFMPIAIEAVSQEQFALWVASKGGTMGGDKGAATDASTDEAAPEAVGEVAGEAGDAAPAA